MTVIKSPLRYPGGKSKLFPFLAQLINQNDLFEATYREPYAGGAGLALNLLFSGFCHSVSLNDFDPAIYSFWWSVVNRNDDFQTRVANIEFNIDEWHAQSEIWRNPNRTNELDLGFATYYLNRTNRSGIIGGAGPIGGYDQSGPYKMDARFSLNEQLTVLNSIKDAAHLIEVTNNDALEYISKPQIADRELIYLDPPYYVKGRRLYRNFYSHDDHITISKLMREFRGNWIVSYDDVPQIREMYEWSHPINVELRYSAGPVGLGQEVIYLSDSLRIQDDISLAA